MKTLKEILSGFIFLPYISFCCLSLVLVWILDKEKSNRVGLSATEFMESNLYILFISSVCFWIYLITKLV